MIWIIIVVTCICMAWLKGDFRSEEQKQAEKIRQAVGMDQPGLSSRTEDRILWIWVGVMVLLVFLGYVWGVR